ncbi:MAG TPA: dipeptidase [Longimicrobiales bacterium]|nr:dipeptidase [Longimicrobiales bacterium]
MKWRGWSLTLLGLALLAACTAADTSVQTEAERIHREAIVIDGYVGTTSQIMWPRWDFTERHSVEESHVDLPRMIEGGLDAAFFSIGAVDAVTGAAAVQVSLEEIERYHQLAEQHPDELALCRTAEDVRGAHEQEKTCILLGMAGGHNIAESLSVLRSYHRLGLSYLHLNHDTNTSWSDAARQEPEHHGLTDFGRSVVREMNRVGLMVDISHVADQSAWAALEESEAPVIASHSGARALAPHVRNMPDDMIRAVAATGGVVMVVYNLPFLDDEYFEAWEAIQPELAEFGAELQQRLPGTENIPRWREEGRRFLATRMPAVPWTRIVDHIDHIVAIAGVEHVGLGSDFDGAVMPEGMEDVSNLPKITEELLRRGYSEPDIKKILGGNILRVMEDVASTSERLTQDEAGA